MASVGKHSAYLDTGIIGGPSNEGELVAVHQAC